ncbi:probable beta-D-xylosidase 5 [Magnolia sinica]|uniref:probable beta-D-xylosidase 5 n=1 Tax=Magnolia sinica TaxID=86752 RepID=UPI00265B5E33|nr:probable beta-D-xylosidase 5 [Magnolia sinica]
MATVELFLLVSLSLLIISTTSRTIHSSHPSSAPHGHVLNGLDATDFTYVCNPEWFTSLGLDMKAFRFCEKSQPFDARAKDLVDSMTLAEKVAQLGNKAYGVPRLGLPKYEWWSEALHGVSNVGPGTRFDNTSVPAATSFPTVILTAASFNTFLWKSIGNAVSTEARAMYNLGLAGLTFWSPNINVVRDPRWGRITETPGEDPYVVGLYAVNYVRGLQDVEGHEDADDLNSRPLKVAACCKHYAAYDVDNWQGVDRYHFDARVTEQDMAETFLRPFEMCVREGDVSSVMCSYNRVNGIPTCADPKLLSETIRGEWDLHGYIVSDCDSIEVIHHGHKWLDDTEEDAVAQVLRAGLDLDCGIYYTNFTLPAIEQGKAREADVDKALKNLYVVLMRLGFFDGNPAYVSLGKDDVCTKDSIDLAAESARQGIVLLENVNNTLPLSNARYKKLAVVGPHANATTVMIGNYAGVPCRYVSPLDGFSAYATVDYHMGCADVACKNDTFIHHAVQASKRADATIILVGLDLSIEAESLDRTDLLLPGYQTQLITQISNVAVGPIILVILSAGCVDISFAKNNPKISTIMWAGYPGQEGGRAIADVVFGQHNPSGRLPITWYTADYVDKLPMTSMQLRPVDEFGYPGRTYKFFNGSTVYPFGYGLSYTQFNYTLKSTQRSLVTKLVPGQHCHDLTHKSDVYVPPCPAVLVDDLKCNEVISLEVEVKNVGPRDGAHVVMVYFIPTSDYVGLPSKQLVGFERVFVAKGGTKTVKFVLDACKSFSVVTDSAYVVLPYGRHTIMVGDGDGAISFPFDLSFHY